jgi:endonuclease/exonuclease/phosphatase family metal-dependent hydrolase
LPTAVAKCAGSTAKRSRTGSFAAMLVFLSVAMLVLASCAPFGGARPGEISVLSYNVQNLFDDVDDGTEYRDYDPGAGNWDTARYHAKLSAIATVITTAEAEGPTIVALQEVENAAALRELAETYLQRAGYRELVLVPAPGSAVNNAVLSKLPVTRVQSHGVADVGSRYPLRDILEVWIDTGHEPLALFVNHWKSRSGGAESTERMRRAAARVVAERVRRLTASNPDVQLLVAGDLNISVDEYDRVDGAYRTALMPLADAAAPSVDSHLHVTFEPASARVTPRLVALYSPWKRSGTPGSYVYRGSWETIDHFLLAPNLVDGADWSFDGFAVVRETFMMDASGAPRRWRDGSGYSDHFPILLTLTYSDSN